MKVQATKGDYICADGKFFKAIGADSQGKELYRQIELYLPAAPGTYGVPIVDTMNTWMEELASGERQFKWAIGSTGGSLTARYQIRSEDGELMSVLALTGGMK